MDTLCDWLRHSHVTVLLKKTNLYHVCICKPQLHYFNMDNKLQALLTWLSLLAAVVKLNSVFHHHATAAYMRRRKDVIQ